MPRKELHVELIAHTPLPEEVCSLGAKLCYSKSDVNALKEKVSSRDQGEFLERIMQSGHLSVLEHASFTFAVEGVSRVLLAQVTRHRIASFSVQSQRYVSLADSFCYIVPPAVEALGKEAVERYSSQMEQMHSWYIEWQKDLGNAGESSNEDARFVLPNACETRFVMTMNVRELKHFFRLRCCSRAQWEIRALAREMLILCKRVSPVLFSDDGPGCVSGSCPEGAKSCGNAAQIREMYKSL